MTEREFNPDDNTIDRREIEEGIVPGLDLQLGAERDISGGDDLAELDEENLYGNDVIVKLDDE